MKNIKENGKSTNNLKRELDDFWDDCINISHSPTCN
jgi:hypothetical protein